MIGGVVILEKIISLFVVLTFIFSFTAYKSDNLQAEISKAQNSSAVEKDDITEKSKNTDNNKILIAYFSRWGNTNYSEEVDTNTSASIVLKEGEYYGTTEYAAYTIQQKVGGDIHLIQTENPYPQDFDILRNQNHEEMNTNYLPTLVESDLNIDDYDVVFLGYPVWATTIPQPILSFMDKYDLSGKTIIPFCTHDGYGSGNSYADIASFCPQATIINGIAIESKDIFESNVTIEEWLNTLDIIQAISDSSQDTVTPIKISIGDTILDGEIYNTELAQEIKKMFPLTVSMVGYGGREFYGRIQNTPNNITEGNLYFENGDITYCAQNNTIAIFYEQTNHPNLTMEVIPIGKVTSNLSIFEKLPSSVEITFAIAE